MERRYSFFLKKECVKKRGGGEELRDGRDWVMGGSAAHGRAVAKAVKGASEKVAENKLKGLKVKFSAHYMTALVEIPFTKFKSQIPLMKMNVKDK